MSTLGVQLGLFHSYNDWGLRWVEPYTIEYPEPKTYTVEIPGADGVLDLTEALSGAVRYNNRKMELTFEVPDGDYYEYERMKRVIAGAIHGRRVKVVLDTDSDYYYMGRLTISATKSSRVESTIVVQGDMDPWKYAQVQDFGDMWSWDDFEFGSGDTRNRNTFLLSSRSTITIPGTRRVGTPTIIADIPTGATASVKVGDTWQTLSNGDNVFPELVVTEEGLTLQFRYTGSAATITIDYPGGEL